MTAAEPRASTALGWVTILVAVALTGCAPQGDEGLPQDGPAVIWPAQMSIVAMPTHAEFTDGFTLFSVKGEKPVTVLKVRPDPVKGLELLGVKVADHSRKYGSLQYVESWPPVDRDLPPESVQELPVPVRPEKPNRSNSLELLIGYRVSEGYSHERLVRRGVWVDYRVSGGKEYTVYMKSGLTVCPDTKSDNCNSPENWLSLYEYDK